MTSEMSEWRTFQRLSESLRNCLIKLWEEENQTWAYRQLLLPIKTACEVYNEIWFFNPTCSTARLTGLSEAATPPVRPNFLQWTCPGYNHHLYERGPHTFVPDKNLHLKVQPISDLLLFQCISPGS